MRSSSIRTLLPWVLLDLEPIRVMPSRLFYRFSFKCFTHLATSSGSYLHDISSTACFSPVLNRNEYSTAVHNQLHTQ